MEIKELINNNTAFHLKPNVGDTIWYIGANGNICPTIYFEVETDLAMLKNGWIFPTQKQAESNKERVMAEYKEVMDNGTK
ncbi:hypothetical protein [Dielma fastidiosa]|uniref:hypothetical protein n=1 Tax=Dielma fastidiosa TaxID=1034346 RepID=UPI000E50B5FE|nr:hypothetical protein [Dielma fastidiosa]RHN01494.1 hypothetical protein DWZ33_05735 [Dielma fastidiosa]